VERPRKERRASVALTSEGLSAQKPIRLGWERRENTPAGGFESGGVLDWTDQPYSDPRLSPRVCLEPAGRFHRGATRGEVVIMTAADTAPRWKSLNPVHRRAEWRVERFFVNISTHP